MASIKNDLTDPLASSLEVVVFVVLTGIAWFNGAELLVTIFVFSKRWSGVYFYCVVASTLGIVVYQLGIFMIVFAAHLNMHGIVVGTGIGWSGMVMGQSLLLWSRLRLVCPSTWKLQLGLYLIVINGICIQTLHIAISLLAVKHNNMDVHRKSLDMIEKISIAIFSAQEILLSIIYLARATRILKVKPSVIPGGSRDRVKWLGLANIVLISITIAVIALEFLVPWILWSSFKGFGYSLKLKIELAVLKDLKAAAIDWTGTMEIPRTNISNPAIRPSISSWYANFAWPKRSLSLRTRTGGISKDGQTEKIAADVHEGPFGDMELNGLDSSQARCFRDVEIT